MKIKILFLTSLFAFNICTNAQVISVIGSSSPSSSWSIDTNMTTTDNITYTLNNAILTTATGPSTGLKFRQDAAWTINWGGNTFPSGVGILDGNNIQPVAGTYNITFNRNNGSYTFIQVSGFASIGIWGPAVNAQLGYSAPDVDMTTTDGINYTLSGFNFSSGQAYFRQNDDGNLTFGSTTFPTGTAVANGPSLFIPGGEWYVSFNKNSGNYSFTYPSIGVLGTAINGFDAADTDLTTTDGFTYTISDLVLSNGEIKFRKDNMWTSNWGSAAFPTGTGTQDGANIPVTAGTYNINFEKSSGNYTFTELMLTNSNFSTSKLKIVPNPTENYWNLKSENEISKIEIFDLFGKLICSFLPNATEFTIDSKNLQKGIYLAKIATNNSIETLKISKSN